MRNDTTRKPMTAEQLLALGNDVHAYIYSSENEELGLDPWTYITGVDQCLKTNDIILEYGSISEKIVKPDFIIYYQA